MNKQKLRQWVAGQFYADVEEKEPSEDYENWTTEQIEEEINRMTESLFNFLKEELRNEIIL